MNVDDVLMKSVIRIVTPTYHTRYVPDTLTKDHLPADSKRFGLIKTLELMNIAFREWEHMI